MSAFTFGCRPKALSIMMGWSFSTDRTVANQEIPATKIPVISSGEIDDSPDISLVRFHIVHLVFSTRIDRKTGLPLLMPPWHPTHFRNLGSIKSAAEYIRPVDLTKKKERHYAPPSGQPASRFPACQFALPETLGALWGRAPPHGKFYRGHARYARHAHHAKRQVYQPGLSPLSRARLL